MTINNVRPILPSVAFIERDSIDHEYRGFEWPRQASIWSDSGDYFSPNTLLDSRWW